jgi:predicted GNAT family acetyltransferase
MEVKKELNRITLLENNKIIGFATFPNLSDNVVNINHTLVYPIYQGKGYASVIMEEVVKVLIETNRKCRASCSYAATWFSKHPEYQYLLD